MLGSGWGAVSVVKNIDPKAVSGAHGGRPSGAERLAGPCMPPPRLPATRTAPPLRRRDRNAPQPPPARPQCSPETTAFMRWFLLAPARWLHPRPWTHPSPSPPSTTPHLLIHAPPPPPPPRPSTPEDGPYELVLVSPRNYMLFTPLLPSEPPQPASTNSMMQCRPFLPLRRFEPRRPQALRSAPRLAAPRRAETRGRRRASRGPPASAQARWAASCLRAPSSNRSATSCAARCAVRRGSAMHAHARALACPTAKPRARRRRGGSWAQASAWVPIAFRRVVPGPLLLCCSAAQLRLGCLRAAS